VSLAELQISVEWWVSQVGGETPEPRALVAFILSKREDVETRMALRKAAQDSIREREESAARWRARHPDATKDDILRAIEGGFPALEARRIPEARRVTPEFREETPEELAEAEARREALIRQLSESPKDDDQ
jgi:hypothetical protein